MKMDNKRAAFVPAAIAKKIATIELRARRLGWPAELLFDPTLDDYGRPLGLAATLDPSDAIVAVRRDLHRGPEESINLLKFPRG
jgi:hypothetical protein